MTTDNSNIFNRLSDLIARGRSLGATDMSVSYKRSVGLAAGIRAGNEIEIERGAASNYGITVFIGQQSSSVAISKIKDTDINGAVRDAVEAARLAPPDPYAGLALPGQIETVFPDLDLEDVSVPALEQLIEYAREAEDVARSMPGIVNSKGSSASRSRVESYVLATNGFKKTSIRTINGGSVSVVAQGNGDRMETDSSSSAAVYRSDLQTAEFIGRQAAERALSKLDPSTVKTGIVPVVFDRRVGSSLLNAFVKAISDNAIAKKLSFLKDHMGEQVFADGISIVDNPLMLRGLGSRANDGDGLPVRKTVLVEKGCLQSWMLDLESARELGVSPTGHGGGPSNITIEAGELSPDELMADIKDGLYVTSIMGKGADIINGTYSQGVSGLWISNGKLSHAVSEATIAGNLKDIFMNMTAANDLDRKRQSRAVPTLRVEGLTLGGK